MIRIANGQGFWGDWLEAPVRLIEEGPIDYLALDYLAENITGMLDEAMHLEACWISEDETPSTSGATSTWKPSRSTDSFSRSLQSQTTDEFHFFNSTASSFAPFSNASGKVALDRSPPSIMIPSLPIPSNRRNVEAAVRTLVAVNKVCLESMKRNTDSACVFP